jgi:hypothetical protein
LGCFRSLDRVLRATKKFADVGGGASATDHGSRRGGRRRAGAARKSRLTAIAYMWNIAVMGRWVQTADVRSGRRLRWSEIQMQRTVRRQPAPCLGEAARSVSCTIDGNERQRGTGGGRTADESGHCWLLLSICIAVLCWCVERMWGVSIAVATVRPPRSPETNCWSRRPCLRMLASDGSVSLLYGMAKSRRDRRGQRGKVSFIVCEYLVHAPDK